MDEGMAGFYIKSGGIRGGGCGNGGTKCGRWNPTAEQVKVLTDLFRSGLRTPSTDQIQKISNQLSFYGKIESKNVFYWFQNHKARERQKRRKVSVGVGEKDVLPSDDTINNSSTKRSAERAIETLQLFPLNSIEEPDSEKVRLHANECKDTFGAFSYTFGAEMGRLPPLDLRLSFM